MFKLEEMGVGGRMFNWINDFLKQRVIRVRVGDAISSQGIVENGTPQGSVISPVLFIVMINDIFSKVDRSVGRSLFADDGALWFRGRNNKFIMGKMQKAVDEVLNGHISGDLSYLWRSHKLLYFPTRK